MIFWRRMTWRRIIWRQIGEFRCQVTLEITLKIDLAKWHVHIPSILLDLFVDSGLFHCLQSAYPAVLKILSLSPWFGQATLEYENFQVLFKRVILLVEMLCKFVIIWSFLGIISVFWKPIIRELVFAIFVEFVKFPKISSCKISRKFSIFFHKKGGRWF